MRNIEEGLAYTKTKKCLKKFSTMHIFWVNFERLSNFFNKSTPGGCNSWLKPYFQEDTTLRIYCIALNSIKDAQAIELVLEPLFPYHE